MKLHLGARRCDHFREDDSLAKAIEFSIEIGRLAICLVVGI